MLQDIILQEATTNQWMDLITTSSPTSFLSISRTWTPAGRIYLAKHVSESSCKWPGVYVVLHRTAIFTFAFAFDKCLKKHFLFSFYLEHMNFILVWTGTYKPPTYAPPHCFISEACSVMTSHPVASCHIITVQHGPSVGQIKQSLSTCGGFYTYRTEVVHGGGAIGSGCGSLPWIKKPLYFAPYTPICSYTYISTTTVPGY